MILTESDVILTENDLYYLRSILAHLREIQSVIDDDGPSLGWEVLADNIDWLDCFIDKHERAALTEPKDGGGDD